MGVGMAVDSHCNAHFQNRLMTHVTVRQTHTLPYVDLALGHWLACMSGP